MKAYPRGEIRPTKDALEDAYSRESAVQLATRFGVSTSTIYRWLRQDRIAIRTYSDARKLALRDPSRRDLHAQVFAVAVARMHLALAAKKSCDPVFAQQMRSNSLDGVRCAGIQRTLRGWVVMTCLCGNSHKYWRSVAKCRFANRQYRCKDCSIARARAVARLVRIYRPQRHWLTDEQWKTLTTPE